MAKIPLPTEPGSAALEALLVIGLAGERKVEKIISMRLDASGGANHDINLSEKFANTPRRMVVGPLGHAGNYRVQYDATTPKLTLVVTGDTENASNVALLIVIAYDQP